MRVGFAWLGCLYAGLLYLKLACLVESHAARGGDFPYGVETSPCDEN